MCAACEMTHSITLASTLMTSAMLSLVGVCSMMPASIKYLLGCRPAAVLRIPPRTRRTAHGAHGARRTAHG